jgi:cytochrome c556
MQVWTGLVALTLVAALGGTALAQGDVVAERRAGLRSVGQHMEAIQGTVQSRGDTRPLVGRVDEMTAFFRTFHERFPAGSLNPAVPQGTGEGQSRALPAIESERAGFVRARDNLLTSLQGLRTAADSGDAGATGRALQETGGACGACHRAYRAR